MRWQKIFGSFKGRENYTLDLIFNFYGPQELFLYPKSELYEITIETKSKEIIKFKINDMMKLHNIQWYAIDEGNIIKCNGLLSFYW